MSLIKHTFRYPYQIYFVKNVFNQTQRSNIKIFISTFGENFVPVTLNTISFNKGLSKT